MSKEIKDQVIAHATKRIAEGKDRKDFLKEMAMYWEIARKRHENRERAWLLDAIEQQPGGPEGMSQTRREKAKT